MPNFHSSLTIRPRAVFTSPRRRFSATLRRRAPALGLRFRARSATCSLATTARAAARRASNFSHNNSHARARFAACERPA